MPPLTTPGLGSIDSGAEFKVVPRRTIVKRETDPFAIEAFFSGLIGLWIIPEILTPACAVCCIVSYHRLKSNPHLKGHGWRISGAILGVINMIFLFWKYQIGMFAPK